MVEKEKMSGFRRALMVMSIVFAAAGAVVVATSTVSMSELLASIPEHDKLGIALHAFLMEIVAFAMLVGIVYVICGVLGIRGALKPVKLAPFMAATVIGIACGTVVLVNAVYLSVQMGPGPVIASLAMIAFPTACLWLSCVVRKRREGFPDGCAGPDGPEYPDGYNPKKLGFMRLLQILFAFNVIFSIVVLTTYIKGSYEITFSMLLDLLNLMFDGVVFWLILKRYSAARKFAIGFSLFNIAIGTVYNLATGNFDIMTQVTLCIFDIVVLSYFLLSRRARVVLNVPFKSDRVKDSLGEGENSFYNIRKWSFWRSIIIYFCVFCVVGHWAEAGYCLFIKWGILPGVYDPSSQIWSDWLYPFPVYGFGMVACIIVLFPLKNLLQRKIHNTVVALVVSFVINALVCTSIELVMGLIQNQPVNGVYPLWDYSDMFCNFMGQVCLQNALAFGAISTFITWLVYPLLEKGMIRLPNNVANVLFIVVVVFFAILDCLYLVNVAVPGIG